MKRFTSFKEIEFELKKLDLQRQITREQIKHNYLLVEQHWTKSIFSSIIIKRLSQLGIMYLIKRLTK